ncbi:MAG: GntR family transcriptional regulator [Pseudomonadota bacterium]
MEPLYRRILTDLTARISAGELAPGQMLPSEADLGAAYGASQGTARKALSMLVDRGILDRRQGRGTFVAISTDERALFHFFRLRDGDGNPVVPVLDRQQVHRRAASETETELGSADVFEIDRLRRIEGRLAVRERIILPTARFPGLGERDMPPNALYPFYQRVWGVAILTAIETLRPAVGRGGDDGLEADRAEPILHVRRVARDIEDVVTELRTCTYAMAGLSYSAELR